VVLVAAVAAAVSSDNPQPELCWFMVVLGWGVTKKYTQIIFFFSFLLYFLFFHTFFGTILE
jgi:hypothetical protein